MHAPQRAAALRCAMRCSAQQGVHFRNSMHVGIALTGGLERTLVEGERGRRDSPWGSLLNGMGDAVVTGASDELVWPEEGVPTGAAPRGIIGLTVQVSNLRLGGDLRFAHSDVGVLRAPCCVLRAGRCTPVPSPWPAPLRLITEAD